MSDKGRLILNKILTAILIAMLVIFMLTFAIGLPIYCRFFYYIQIDTLDMPEKTGWSYWTIRRAYDDILNFCTLPGFECKTGELALSKEGAAHFADCKRLFDLNLALLIVSAAHVIALTLLHKFKVITFVRPAGRRAYFWAAVIAVSVPVIIALLALCVGFDRAFEVFHKVFFPGKDNWVFDMNEDQIINVMPQEFFMNCAIIIGVGLVAFAGALIATDLIVEKKVKTDKEEMQ